MNQLDTVKFWTQVGDEPELIREFALIPNGWENKLEQHPQDDNIFYWCDANEFLMLGAGEILGGVSILSCACEECGYNG